jgi:hypothetical protein
LETTLIGERGREREGEGGRRGVTRVIGFASDWILRDRGMEEEREVGKCRKRKRER